MLAIDCELFEILYFATLGGDLGLFMLEDYFEVVLVVLAEILPLVWGELDLEFFDFVAKSHLRDCSTTTKLW